MKEAKILREGRARNGFQTSRRREPSQPLSDRLRKRRAHWCPLTKTLALCFCLAYGIPLKDGSEQTDEEAEGPFSDDEMVTHKGLRRSQSMKSVKTIKGRKEVSVPWVKPFLTTLYHCSCEMICR